MAYTDIPDFLVKLRNREAVAARALEFAILTAARTGEVLGATFSEMDLNDKVWTVPSHRMKSGRTHRVPLSDRAVELVKQAKSNSQGYFLFSSPNSATKPLSSMAMEMLLRRMGVSKPTVHGFRSSFRDWAGECTDYPRELAEAALAHAIGDSVERAYRRGDALERRRKLMTAWDTFLNHPEPKMFF